MLMKRIVERGREFPTYPKEEKNIKPLIKQILAPLSLEKEKVEKKQVVACHKTEFLKVATSVVPRTTNTTGIKSEKC